MFFSVIRFKHNFEMFLYVHFQQTNVLFYPDIITVYRCGHLPMRYENSQRDHPACFPLCFTKRILSGPVQAPRQQFPEAILKIPQMANCALLGAIA